MSMRGKIQERYWERRRRDWGAEEEGLRGDGRAKEVRKRSERGAMRERQRRD